MSKKQPNKNNVIECYICLANFSAKHTLQTHIASVHESKKREYVVPPNLSYTGFRPKIVYTGFAPKIVYTGLAPKIAS